MTDFDYEHMTPENVRGAAHTAAEAIRYMNHATIFAGSGGLKYPSDVDAVLVSLESLGERLPQLVKQLGDWLIAECRAGRVRVTSAPPAHSPSIEARAVSMVRQYLTEADGHAGGWSTSVHDARQITAALAGVPGEGKEGES